MRFVFQYSSITTETPTTSVTLPSINPLGRDPPPPLKTHKNKIETSNNKIFIKNKTFPTLFIVINSYNNKTLQSDSTTVESIMLYQLLMSSHGNSAASKMASLLGEHLFQISGQGPPPQKDFFQLLITNIEVEYLFLFTNDSLEEYLWLTQFSPSVNS